MSWNCSPSSRAGTKTDSPGPAHRGLCGRQPGTVPQALLHNLKHNQVLHELNLILTVAFHEVPWIPVRAAGAGHSPLAQASGALS